MKSFLFLAVLFCFIQVKGQVSGYYIKTNNDTVKGTISAKYMPMSDSIYWIKMQEEVHFADVNGKKENIVPSASIKELGFKLPSGWQKMRTFQGKDFGKLSTFSDNEYKFINVRIEGKINAYLYSYKNFSMNNTFDVIVVNKVSTGEWGTVELFKHKKLGKKIFED